ncbi:hypothetical protein ACIQMR_35260 [Streptomyces sp. NPDC091376]|uniref:hypothetical protein n=1 Tax=Streptomyces sp. NPDC091376 TaxID=3365994 RepID=UPI00381AE63D
MTYRLAGVAVLAAFIVIMVGCQAEVDEWSQAPDTGIEIDVDAPKVKKPKAPTYKAPKPAYKAPSTSKARR